MSQIKWRRRALGDIDRLSQFLQAKNPQAARHAAQVILDGAKQLKANPEIGRLMDDGSNRRELFLPFGAGAYVIRYLLSDPQTVIVIRVWHSRENRK